MPRSLSLLFFPCLIFLFPSTPCIASNLFYCIFSVFQIQVYICFSKHTLSVLLYLFIFPCLFVALLLRARYFGLISFVVSRCLRDDIREINVPALRLR